MAFFIIITIALFGILAWGLIFFSLKNQNIKCTYDILKMITSLTMMFAILGLVTLPSNISGEVTNKWLLLLRYLAISQAINTINLFNVYSFVFEQRNPKIDPNLPLWMTSILGILLPFCVTLLTLYFDGWIDFSTLIHGTSNQIVTDWYISILISK